MGKIIPKKKSSSCKKKGHSINCKRELIYKDIGQEYAIVEENLGDSRLIAKCFDGEIRICHVRGTIRKRKARFKKEDFILISVREFQESKADILLKYKDDEARVMKLNEELSKATHYENKITNLNLIENGAINTNTTVGTIFDCNTST